MSIQPVRSTEYSDGDLKDMRSKFKSVWGGGSLWNKIAFQVLISVDSNDKQLEKALNSIDEAIMSFNKECKWILLFGDSDSQDESLKILGEYARRSSADKIHLYDFDHNEKKGINENKLIKEAHEFSEEYPAVLFMEAGGEMTPERPMMIYSAAAYNSPYVVGAWFDSITGDTKNSWDAIEKGHYGPWATLFHISFLPKDGKFFYETVNKGRDVLTWKQLNNIQNIYGSAHLRELDVVHKYGHSDEGYKTQGSEISFKNQDLDCKEEPRSLQNAITHDNWEEESKKFIQIKSQLESGHDILKYVE
jgi:hypothetical protein